MFLFRRSWASVLRLWTLGGGRAELPFVIGSIVTHPRLSDCDDFGSSQVIVHRVLLVIEARDDVALGSIRLIHNLQPKRTQLSFRG